ncbi:MAG: FAD:protein FMN transferase [Candidatus Eiseniibacteriota bacterium]
MSRPSASSETVGARTGCEERRAGFGPGIVTLLVLAGAIMGAWPVGCASVGAAAQGQAARRSVVFPTRTMGTYANIIIVTADSAAAAPQARRAQVELWRIDSLMTNWTATSEVARINREAGHRPLVVDPEVATVLDTSLDVWSESDHAFDITVEPLVRAWGFLGGPRRVPTDAEAAAAFRKVGAQRVHYQRDTRTLNFESDSVKIDLGGIAKGYAVEAARRALIAAGVQDALIDLTGNMAAIGTPAGLDHWRIGIRDPRDRMPYFAQVKLFPGEGISTSGKYEQFVAQNGKTYGHIMDPRTGRPADGLISVTVISNSAFTCDTWDTPLFVLGAEAAKAKAHQRSDFAAILVGPGAGKDTVWVERSLLGRFTLETSASGLFIVQPF